MKKIIASLLVSSIAFSAVPALAQGKSEMGSVHGKMGIAKVKVGKNLEHKMGDKKMMVGKGRLTASAKASVEAIRKDYQTKMEALRTEMNTKISAITSDPANLLPASTSTHE